MKEKTGRDEKTGLYINRYYANKAKSGGEVAVKVDGGYTLMSYSNYQTWRKQK